MAPEIAKLMAKELNKTATWEKKQIAEYTQLANHYLV
jgi:glycerol-3-phosphate dehydrogenase